MSELQDALDLYDDPQFIIIQEASPELRTIIEAATQLANLRNRLAHHLTERTDPCQDRGVEWPCDVAAALGEVAPDGQ